MDKKKKQITKIDEVTEAIRQNKIMPVKLWYMSFGAKQREILNILFNRHEAYILKRHLITKEGTETGKYKISVLDYLSILPELKMHCTADGDRYYKLDIPTRFKLSVVFSNGFNSIAVNNNTIKIRRLLKKQAKLEEKARRFANAR